MNITTTTRHPRRLLRWSLLAAALVLVGVLLTGCPTGQSVTGFGSEQQFQSLGAEMRAIEQMSQDDLKAKYSDPVALQQFVEEIEGATPTPQGKASDLEKAKAAKTAFLKGYIAEFLATAFPQNTPWYTEAQNQYTLASSGNTPYAGQASYRLGLLAVNTKIGGAGEANNLAKRYLRGLTQAYDIKVWVRTPALAGQDGTRLAAPATTTPSLAPTAPGTTAPATTPATAPGAPTLESANLANTAIAMLDTVYRTGGGLDQAYWMALDKIVSGFKQVFGAYGVAMALLFLAVLVKVITIPFTNASFRGMRDMQRIQPMIKALQEKYKDDKAKIAQEQMELMKTHKVSPLGGCLPMLIQLPVFIVVLNAVNVYARGFQGASFIWIGDLARPDYVLLGLYLVSMFLTQKLTATPATDPQQKAMQTQMNYIMPVFLAVFLYKFPSAFVLYWFFLNVLSSAHQYYLLKKFQREDEVAGAVTVADTGASSTSQQKKGKKQS